MTAHAGLPRGRTGFTLVEVLLACALGATIIGTAFAGFRVASQAATVANRLSTENALMRAGLTKAEEELDFWLTYDDPCDANHQQLRTCGVAGANGGCQGLAFAPMSVMMPASGSMENAIGWDANGWRCDDPRAWCRSNLIARDNSDLRFGHYAIFANASPAPSIEAVNGCVYTVAKVAHHWFDRQVQTFMSNTSFFMMCDYLPPNTIYCYMQDYQSGSTTPDGVPFGVIQPGNFAPDGTSSSFCNPDGERNARGKYIQTYMASIAVSPPSSAHDLASTDPVVQAQAFQLCWRGQRQIYHTGYDSQPQDITTFVDQTTIHTPLLDNAPAAWPQVKVSVNRFIKNARVVALFRISVANPLNGSVTELSFSGFGTTLRGARQQRLYDQTNPGRQQGWANWDDAGLAPNDPTLDSSSPQ